MNDINEKKKMSKFEKISIICIVLLLIFYEFGYCNLKSIAIDHRYNFSLCRIVIYAFTVFLIIKFGKNIVKNAEKTFESKKEVIFLLFVFSALIDLIELKDAIYAQTPMQKIYQMYNFCLLALAEINGLLFIMYINRDYVNNIIVSILTFGVVFTYTMPFAHQIDEKTHFLTCLNFAVGNFGLYEGEALSDTIFDQITKNMPSIDFATSFFDVKCNFNMTKLKFDDSTNIPSTYRTPIAYIPGTIGILFARLFGGSVADVFLCGRLMNILTFGFLLVITFKILPYKKKLFYFIFLLPIAMGISATYTTDGVTIGLIGIFIAYILKLYDENKEKITMKEFIILCLTYLLVLTCKDSSYMGIGFLVFILPIRKYFKNNKTMKWIAILLVGIVILIGTYELKIKTVSNQGDSRMNNTNSVLQLEYIKQKPSRLFTVYDNFAKESLLKLSWYNNLNPKYIFGNESYVVNFVLFIYGLYISYIDTSKTFGGKTMILMFITAVVTFGITSFALYWLYTPVGNDTIVGYQTRYLIPFLPLVLASFSSRHRINKDYKDLSVYDKSALVLGTLTFIDILSQILV